jgi:hypothetical protein
MRSRISTGSERSVAMTKGSRLNIVSWGLITTWAGSWNENEVTESENNFTAFRLIFDAQFTPRFRGLIF